MEKQEEKQENKDVILSIIYNPESGHVLVNGPIKDKMLSIWLLDEAKDVIKGYHANEARKNASKLVKPNGQFLNGLRGFLK